MAGEHRAWTVWTPPSSSSPEGPPPGAPAPARGRPSHPPLTSPRRAFFLSWLPYVAKKGVLDSLCCFVSLFFNKSVHVTRTRQR